MTCGRHDCYIQESHVHYSTTGCELDYQEVHKPNGGRMTLETLLDYHVQLCTEARELMQRKNHDYASDADVFRNFREFGRVGILVRLSDKLSRLRAHMEKGEFQVHDEKVRDTVQDAINYLVLFESYEELPRCS